MRHRRHPALQRQLPVYLPEPPTGCPRTSARRLPERPETALGGPVMRSVELTARLALQSKAGPPEQGRQEGHYPVRQALTRLRVRERRLPPADQVPHRFTPSRRPGADRGAHLRRLRRLLPARDLEEPGPTASAGVDASGDPGEVLDPADGRCPSAHHRRAPLGAASPYATRTGSPTDLAGTCGTVLDRVVGAARGHGWPGAPRPDPSPPGMAGEV